MCKLGTIVFQRPAVLYGLQPLTNSETFCNKPRLVQMSPWAKITYVPILA